MSERCSRDTGGPAGFAEVLFFLLLATKQEYGVCAATARTPYPYTRTVNRSVEERYWDAYRQG
jgi:hypothetical protein